MQNRFPEALSIYAEARDTFAALDEPLQVAKVWHQIGMVHERVGQLESAEQAYRQSLAIKVRHSKPTFSTLAHVHSNRTLPPKPANACSGLLRSQKHRRS